MASYPRINCTRACRARWAQNINNNYWKMKHPRNTRGGNRYHPWRNPGNQQDVQHQRGISSLLDMSQQQGLQARSGMPQQQGMQSPQGLPAAPGMLQQQGMQSPQGLPAAPGMLQQQGMQSPQGLPALPGIPQRQGMQSPQELPSVIEIQVRQQLQTLLEMEARQELESQQYQPWFENLPMYEEEQFRRERLKEIRVQQQKVQECWIEIQGLNQRQMEHEILKREIDEQRKKMEQEMYATIRKGNFLEMCYQQLHPSSGSNTSFRNLGSTNETHTFNNPQANLPQISFSRPMDMQMSQTARASTSTEGRYTHQHLSPRASCASTVSRTSSVSRVSRTSSPSRASSASSPSRASCGSSVSRVSRASPGSLASLASRASTGSLASRVPRASPGSLASLVSRASPGSLASRASPGPLASRATPGPLASRATPGPLASLASVTAHATVASRTSVVSRASIISYPSSEPSPFIQKTSARRSRTRRRKSNSSELEDIILDLRTGKLFETKSAVKLIRVLLPGARFQVSLVQSTVVYKAQIMMEQTILGEGQGETNATSAQLAAEKAIKAMFCGFFSSYSYFERPSISKEVQFENPINVFPWIEFGCFALHRLLAEWQSEGVTIVFGHPRPKPSKKKKGSKNPLKNMPRNPNQINPCDLLHKMKPESFCFEVDKPLRGQKGITTIAYDINGEVFIGQGHRKKQAKKQAAKMALKSIYGLTFPNFRRP